MVDCAIEETDATNELIHDKNEDVQPLTAEEIESMKKSGMHASVRPSLELFPFSFLDSYNFSVVVSESRT